MFAPRCKACGIAIMEGYISAMGTQWHPECFVCKVSITKLCTLPLYIHHELYLSTHTVLIDPYNKHNWGLYRISDN